MILAIPWLLAVLGGTPMQSDENADATEIVARGHAHYTAGDFAEAAAAFAQAYAIDRAPATLYRWAQSERRAGNCPVAVQLYRRYLEHVLPPENIDAAQKNLARCGHVEPAPDPLANIDAEPKPPEGDATPEPPPRHWARDPAGATLVAFGSAGLVAGIALAGASAGEHAAARDAAIEEDYVRHRELSGSLRLAAIVTGSIGAALFVGGVVRWAIVKNRNASRRVAVDRGGVSIRF